MEKVQKIVVTHGGVKKAQKIATKFTQKAQTEIDQLADKHTFKNKKTAKGARRKSLVTSFFDAKLASGSPPSNNRPPISQSIITRLLSQCKR